MNLFTSPIKFTCLVSFKVFCTTSMSSLPALLSDFLERKHTLMDGMSLLSPYSVAIATAVFLSLSLFTEIITWAMKNATRPMARSLPPLSAFEAISKKDWKGVCVHEAQGKTWNRWFCQCKYLDNIQQAFWSDRITIIQCMIELRSMSLFQYAES